MCLCEGAYGVPRESGFMCVCGKERVMCVWDICEASCVDIDACACVCICTCVSVHVATGG